MNYSYPQQYPYVPVSPYASTQARLSQMEQQYPQFMPQQQSQPPMPQATQQVQQQLLTARMVTGKEEALAVPVDFSGALMVFADVSHNKIYTKAFNQGTGSADIHTYVLDNTPEPVPAGQFNPNDYVTRKEYNDLLEVITGGKSNANESNNDSSKPVSKEKPGNGSGTESGSKNAGR